MNPSELSTEELLAAALRGEARTLPSAWNRSGATEALVETALYHGVAGLLLEQGDVLRCWPTEVVERLTLQARAQAMWEMRHRETLSTLLAALAKQCIPALLMKGTAIAYDLYDNPSARSRGDTDVLVAARDVPEVKSLLAKLGYSEGVLGGVDAEFALQQPWTLSLVDGSDHSIDLHWQVMNAPSLKDLLSFAESDANAQELARLSPDARAMDRVRLLIHTCLHRAIHGNTPYFVNRVAYYGSGRLIWTYDIHLLAKAFESRQWSLFCALAKEKGVSRVCLEGLLETRAKLGTKVPHGVISDLKTSVGDDRKSPYLVRSRSISRAWQDIRAIPGLALKIRYARARLLPDARFVRAKYPEMANASLPLLYAMRLVALVRSRSGSGQR